LEDFFEMMKGGVGKGTYPDCPEDGLVVDAVNENVNKKEEEKVALDKDSF
jgi:hypothetical protein